MATLKESVVREFSKWLTRWTVLKASSSIASGNPGFSSSCLEWRGLLPQNMSELALSYLHRPIPSVYFFVTILY